MKTRMQALWLTSLLLNATACASIRPGPWQITREPMTDLSVTHQALEPDQALLSYAFEADRFALALEAACTFTTHTPVREVKTRDYDNHDAGETWMHLVGGSLLLGLSSFFIAAGSDETSPAHILLLPSIPMGVSALTLLSIGVTDAVRSGQSDREEVVGEDLDVRASQPCAPKRPLAARPIYLRSHSPEPNGATFHRLSLGQTDAQGQLHIALSSLDWQALGLSAERALSLEVHTPESDTVLTYPLDMTVFASRLKP